MCDLSASLWYIFLCRPGSTPPYLWITQQALPSQYRTVQILWACCLVYSLTHEQGIIKATHCCSFILFFQWTAYEHHHTVANHRGCLKEGSEADIDLTACQMVKGQCEELKRLFFTVQMPLPPGTWMAVASPIN